MRTARILAALSLAGAIATANGAEPRNAANQNTWVEPITGMRFVVVPKGCFSMGTARKIFPPPDSYWQNIAYEQTTNEDERPVHEVCLDTYWIGAHEVRIGDWNSIMEKTEQTSAGDLGLPVRGITWAQAKEFARRLEIKSGSRSRFRLPTEAEWERACRAGEVDRLLPAETLVQHAWFRVRGLENPAPHPVGQLAPNPFGAFDMLGNVWEWTTDSYAADAYSRHALHDPRVELAATPRVIRGGSVRSEHLHVRCGKRSHQAPEHGLETIGFRIVRER